MDDWQIAILAAALVVSFVALLLRAKKAPTKGAAGEARSFSDRPATWFYEDAPGIGERLILRFGSGWDLPIHIASTRWTDSADVTVLAGVKKEMEIEPLLRPLVLTLHDLGVHYVSIDTRDNTHELCIIAKDREEIESKMVLVEVALTEIEALCFNQTLGATT